MLTDYTKKELEELARIYRFQGAYKLKKGELIEALTEFIPLHIEEVITMLDPKVIESFEGLMKKEVSVHQGEDIIDYIDLLQLSLADFEPLKEGGKVTVPDSIKKAYNKLDKKAVKVKAAVYDEIRTHCSGILNLYGVVETDWLCQLFNRYHEKQLSEAEVLDFISKDRKLSAMTQIVGSYVAHETVWSLEEENFFHFIELTKDKPYYVPTKEYIKLMSDEEYYDNTLQVQKLKSYLWKKLSKDEELIEEAVITVVMFSKMDCERTGDIISMILDEWHALGIEIRDLNEANEAVKHIVDVMNTTRKWVNRGYTPEELSLRNLEGTQRPKAKVSKLDIGRNEPCHCGSGKKYKKCCGKR